LQLLCGVLYYDGARLLLLCDDGCRLLLDDGCGLLLLNDNSRLRLLDKDWHASGVSSSDGHDEGEERRE